MTRDISMLDITESPREESALFLVEMLERLEIQSSEEFRKEFSKNEGEGSTSGYVIQLTSEE